MATIQYIVNAVNNASKTFSDIATSAAKMGAAIDRAQAAADHLNGALAAQTAAANRAADALDKLAFSAAAAAGAQKALADNTDTGARVARGAFGAWGALWGLWGRKLPVLFGGAVSIGAIHLLVDGIAEFLAVVVPASIALAAFGAGAAPVIADLAKQLQNLNTVTQATGQKLGIMNGATTGNIGAFQKLQDAVKPAVYQQFGDILTVISQNSGFLTKLATATGQVLETLGARFAVATRSAGGFLGIVAKGPSDLSRIGDIFAHLGSILGSFIRAVPGYAVVLLALFDDFTSGAAKIAEFLVPVLKVGLALHGLFLYVGLAVSGLFALRTAFTALLATNFVGWVGGIVANMVALGLEMAQTAGDGDILAAAMVAIDAVNPFAWVAIAVGALAGLVVLLARTKTATQEMGAAMQQSLMSAPLTSAFSTIKGDLTTVNRLLPQTTATLGKMAVQNESVQHAVMGAHDATATYNSALDAQSQKQQQEIGISKQLQAEAQTYNTNLNATSVLATRLTGSYVGQKDALALLNFAGVTTNEMLSKNAETQAIVAQKVRATIEATQAFGQTTGTLANDLSLLGKQTGDAFAAMQKLNQAWDTQTQAVTGTQTAFDTYVTGLKAVDTAADKSRATMDGLNTRSIALNQAFATQVGNVNSLADSWRSAGISNNLFTRGIKDSIAPLTDSAKGSHEATAQLVSLAQEAGYDGPAAMKNLVKWLGNTHDATQTVKDITNQATIQEALLTSSMRAQGSYIANTLIGDINNAILKYDGVQKAAQAYGTAVAEDGRQSDQAHAARQRLIDDLIKSGLQSHDTTKQIAAMITKILGIPTKRAIQIVETGIGKFSVTQTSAQRAGQVTARTHSLRAAGGLISAGTGPTSDDVPALLSRGEYVVKAAAVSRYGTHMMNMINAARYAGGGVVTGQAEVSQDAQFRSKMTAAMEKAMTTAAQKAQAAAASSGAGVAGPGGGAPAANAALARRMYPPWGSGAEWNAWNAVAMAESGWNQFARNPSSGAYGIPQALPASKMGAAANPPQSNPAAQISWMISYIRSVYGDPIGAAAHENAFHWYGSGFHGSVNRPTLFGAGERGPERVDITPAGQGQRIVLEVRAGDGSAHSAYLVGEIQKYVIIHGGDVQAALGQRA